MQRGKPCGRHGRRPGFDLLKAPIRRVTVSHEVIPYALSAEAAVIPNAERIAETVRKLMKNHLERDA